MKKKRKTKNTSNNEIKSLIERLAASTAKGFTHMEKQFDEKLDLKILKLEERLGNRFDGVNNRIDELALNRATRDEMKILSIRVDRLELRTGIRRR